MEQISWSFPEDFGRELPATPAAAMKPVPILEEEIWQLVQDAYKAQGKGVPLDEAKACLKAIREAKAPKAPEPEYERPKTAEEVLGPRPAWGDPEFWSWWNRAKALGLVQPKKKKTPKAEKVKQPKATEKKKVSK